MSSVANVSTMLGFREYPETRKTSGSPFLPRVGKSINEESMGKNSISCV